MSISKVQPQIVCICVILSFYLHKNTVNSAVFFQCHPASLSILDSETDAEIGP